MFEAVSGPLEGTLGTRVTLSADGAPMSFRDVVEAWGSDPAFQRFFGDALLATPTRAFYWETPPVTRASYERAFECALIPAPELDRMTPEPTAFREHFASRRGEGEIATFENLGRDALLVAPAPDNGRGAARAYPHLAEFLRVAPLATRCALWSAVSDAVEHTLGDEPLWVSTSGLGVAWLHVRLDSWPKYYQHSPYRSHG